MESRLRSNLSYTWKGVWAAKGLLKLGMYWRVGSGSSISIWNDAWEPRLEDYRLQRNVIGQHCNLVSELLDQHSRQWKEEIITHIMSVDKVRKVLSIPLSRHWQEDKQAWRAKAFGEYSKRRLRNTIACPRCTHDDEFLEHAFRDCQGDFEDVKYLLVYVNVVRKLQTMDRLVICEFLIRFMQNNYLCHLGFGGDRNKQVHEMKIRHNIETVRFITAYLKGLEEIKGHLSARCVQKARWRPLEGSSDCGMRMILNDYVPTPFAEEVIACLEGVQMGLDLGFQRVILEGDSFTVVKKLQNKNKDISEINPIIEDVKRVSQGFVECRFNFVGRNINETSHRLTKEGLVNGETSYLMERTPKAVWKATEEDSRWAELGHLHRFGFLGRDPWEEIKGFYM
ncbi:hypothetical protein CXB51_014828 [Gossypium anomalum]|uniref:RNase H type-1 domain-containing protein n=1 Tax=Gossypium anomalum TaxID=47600 RepID=A0A8J6D511_9ROSI|nr:hypothetical protein CXB51_014828 [Gossypium anomalum]